MQKKNWLVIILGVFVCGMFLFGWVYTSLSADDFYVIPAGNRNVKTDTTNTAVGVNALKANTAGQYNTATGANALAHNTTASGNTAVGEEALSTQSFDDNTNNWASYNTAVGIRALFANQPTSAAGGGLLGVYNTALGAFSLAYNTTGTDNTAVGSNALWNNTTANKNTAVGSGALQTQSFDNNGTNYDTANTAVGFRALFANQPTSTSEGAFNTALGSYSLANNTTGISNTAAGYCAACSNIDGYRNTAFGEEALFWNTSGIENTAIGTFALYNCSGHGNVALGYGAGYDDIGTDNFSGSNNIYIGRNAQPGSLTESDTIRIGNNYDKPQTQTFIAGIAGNPIASGNYVAVDPNTGQLGIVGSSRRYKEDIKDMGAASAGLMQLRPVTFYYKPKYAQGEHTLQYGLIAEEVAKVYPDLVQYDKNGRPQTVYYHLINAMLLNEVQKQHRQLQAETKELKTLQATVAALQQQQRLSAAQNRKLLARLAQLEIQVKKVAAASKPAGYRPVVEAAAASAIP
jgi:hypothetical protein